MRYDWLTHHLFDSIAEVQTLAIQWLWTSNYERLNMALGSKPLDKNWPWRSDLYF